MGSNSAKAFGAQGRDDLLRFDPNELTLVTDKKHPLYDPRVEEPPDESLVLNIMVHGVLEPVIVRKNGEARGKPIVEVVAGRRRVTAAREANKRLRKEGKEPILVPAVRRRGEDVDMFGVMASENSIRKNESPLEQAKKIQRHIDMGASEDRVAIVFGVSRSTIRQRLALLDAAPEVKRAVESGKLSSVAAARLSKLPREEQVEQLPDLMKEGGSQKERARDIVPPTRQRMIGRGKLGTLLERLESFPDPPSAADVVRFILGQAELETRWTEDL